MSKKKTPKQKQLHSEFMKQRRRIQSLVRKASKRGYTWEVSPIGEIPEKITKREIEKLKRLTPEKLYKKATYTPTENVFYYTGEFKEISGIEGRKLERKASAVKAFETKKENLRKKADLEKRRLLREIHEYPTPDENKEIEEVIESAITALEDAEYNELTKTGDKQTDILAEDYDEIVEEEEREFQDRKLDNEIYHEDTEPQRTKRKDVYEYDEDIPWNDLDQTNITLEYLEGEIERWTPQANWSEMLVPIKEGDKNRLTEILQSAIAQSSRLEVAMRVENSSGELKNLFDEILYASGSKEGNFKDGRTQVNADLARVKEILQGGTLTMEQAKALEELLERNEDYS